VLSVSLTQKVSPFQEHGTAHDGIWPLIDWQQYPGTTIQQGKLQKCAWHYTYDSSPTFTGSVSDGWSSAAAQKLAQDEGLRARRSWLFLDDGIASLITHATSNSTNQVLTTVANQNLADGEQIFVTTKPGPKGVPGGSVPLG